MHDPWRVGVLAVVVALALGACGGPAPDGSAAPSGSGGDAASPVAASFSAGPSDPAPSRALPSAAPSAAAAQTPKPLPLPERPSLAVGDLVMVVTDGLRVRSKPRVASDSTKYDPVLGYGADLSILAGPVGASGYWWYKVHLEDGLQLRNGLVTGWVAAGDHDGEPWIQLVDDGLPGPDTDPVPEPTLAVPVVAAARTEDYAVDGAAYTRYILNVVNWADYPGWLFEPEPDLEPCGLNTSASRAWVAISDAATDDQLNVFCALSAPQDLLGLWFARRRGEAAPAMVYVTIWDRYGETVTSESVPPVPALMSPAPS